jgi:hypothetical protein
MFSQILLDPELESNFVDAEGTRELVRDVVIECHRQNWSRSIDHELIDHRQIENQLTRVVDAALKSTNPKSDLAPKVSVGWNLNLVQGTPMFIGVIHIGVDTKEMDRHEDRWAGVVSGMHLVQ